MEKNNRLQFFLDERVQKYNNPAFITKDPISIPHEFTLLQDIEIIGFWTALLAWGQRVTIINKARQLTQWMDNSPYEFIVRHEEKDRQKFEKFVHRTFNATDTVFFLERLQQYYRKHESLEWAFSQHLSQDDTNTEKALIGFHELFFNHPFAPQRTRKHVSTPIRKSSCKRLNMFLRWMVRNDDKGVDFGLWKAIRMDQLVIPLDVHVDRVARHLGLLQRKQTDWLAAMELTENLKQFDPIDPVKYDFALFGMGVMGKENWKF